MHNNVLNIWEKSTDLCLHTLQSCYMKIKQRAYTISSFSCRTYKEERFLLRKKNKNRIKN